MVHSSISAFKMKTKTGATLLTLLFIFSLVLSACSGGGAHKARTGPTRMTINGGPSGDYAVAYSPYDTTTTTPGTRSLLYETLLFTNLQKSETLPWLASSYQFSPDATTLTLSIRQGIKWSDGQSFSADDVFFTLNMLKKYPAADGNQLWSYFASVTEPDSNSVVIKLKKAYLPILYYVGNVFIVPKHVFELVGDPTKFINAHPVTTGPYLVQSFSPQLVVLKKNPNYWQADKFQVQELRFPAYNNNESVQLDLERGNIDWAGIFLNNVATSYVKRDPAHNHYWFPPSSTTLLYLNLAEAPFQQLAVRQAISLSLDRQKMVTVGESGYSTLANPTGIIVPNQQKFVAPEYNGQLLNGINDTKAEQLLQGAGYTKGSDGIYAKNGQKLSFSIIGVQGWTDEDTDEQIISDNLKAIGINLTVNLISVNDYYTKLFNGQFDMVFNGSTTGPTPYYFYAALLSSKNTAPIGQYASSNWERYQNPTTDQLLNQYAATADQAQQTTIVTQLQHIMVEQLPAIPLFYGVYFNEYSTKNFTGWPDTENAYASPAPWMNPDVAMVLMNLKPVS